MERCLQIDASGSKGFKQVQTSKGPAAEFSGGLLVLAVGVSRQAGGGQQLCPDALLDDGLLDVTYVLNIGVDKLLADFFGGGSNGTEEAPDAIGTLRCKWLELDCEDGLQVRTFLSSLFIWHVSRDRPVKCDECEASDVQVNRDGEPMRDTRFRFEILPKRIALHLPSTDLLSEGGEPLQLSAKPEADPDLHRTPAQQRFLRKLASISRPRAARRGVARLTALASAAAGYAIAFAGGAAVGVWAVSRGAVKAPSRR